MNKNTRKKVLVVSNYALDNTTDLYRSVNKMKNELQALPEYIDYVTYKGTDFLKFITAKYSQGYRIIIGDFYSSQCLAVFNFLNNHDDLLLISSASTTTFTKQMPTNLLRIPSDDEKSFSLFKSAFLDSTNKVLLSVDSTLSKFPRQKRIINLNDKTFVKTVNVLYTDEDIYNLSYVRMIKRNITGKESYKFKFYKIDSATIAQNKLTPEATAILKTTDASNVFMIITISYAQQFLNILSSSNNKCIFQMMFLCDAFVSSKLVVKSQLPYAYTMVNENSPRCIDYFQRLLFDSPGYINYYTVSILCFLKLHTELINNNIINDLSTTDMIEILARGNEYIKGQPINIKKSVVTVPYLLLSQKSNSKKPKKAKKKLLNMNTQSNARFPAAAAAAAAAALKNGTKDTITASSSTVTLDKTEETETETEEETYKIIDIVESPVGIIYLLKGLQYLLNNRPDTSEILESFGFIKYSFINIYEKDTNINNISFDDFINTDFYYWNLCYWIWDIKWFFNTYEEDMTKYGYGYGDGGEYKPFPKVVINGKKINWLIFKTKGVNVLEEIYEIYEMEGIPL